MTPTTDLDTALSIRAFIFEYVNRTGKSGDWPGGAEQWVLK